MATRKLRLTKLKISPHTYDLRAEEGYSQVTGNSGSCGTDQTLIVYDPADSLSATRETIVHEVLHALFTQTELDRIHSDDEEERIVWSLAPRILGFLRDNKRFVEWLVAD